MHAVDNFVENVDNKSKLSTEENVIQAGRRFFTLFLWITLWKMRIEADKTGKSIFTGKYAGYKIKTLISCGTRKRPGRQKCIFIHFKHSADCG